ncbi:hypothetical protein G9A89_000285, partial [Geosiphon pyriformis]
MSIAAKKAQLANLRTQLAVAAAERNGKVLPDALKNGKRQPQRCTVCHQTKTGSARGAHSSCAPCTRDADVCGYKKGHLEAVLAEKVAHVEKQLTEKLEKKAAADKKAEWKAQHKIEGPTDLQAKLIEGWNEGNANPLGLQQLLRKAIGGANSNKSALAIHSALTKLQQSNPKRAASIAASVAKSVDSNLAPAEPPNKRVRLNADKENKDPEVAEEEIVAMSEFVGDEEHD